MSFLALQANTNTLSNLFKRKQWYWCKQPEDKTFEKDTNKQINRVIQIHVFAYSLVRNLCPDRTPVMYSKATCMQNLAARVRKFRFCKHFIILCQNTEMKALHCAHFILSNCLCIKCKCSCITHMAYSNQRRHKMHSTT